MTVALAAFAAGLLVGVLACWPVARRRAYVVCQRQAIRDNAPRPAIADGYNPMPHQRSVSPADERFVWRPPAQARSRPVMHD